MNGLKWRNSTNWCSSKPLNEWYGITTYEKRKKLIKSKKTDGVLEPYVRKVSIGRVISIYLGENGLEGTFSNDDTSDNTFEPQCGLSSLNELTKLSLYGNYINGRIPPVLCKLIRLNYIDLEENFFISLPVGISLECKTVIEDIFQKKKKKT